MLRAHSIAALRRRRGRPRRYNAVEFVLTLVFAALLQTPARLPMQTAAPLGRPSSAAAAPQAPARPPAQAPASGSSQTSAPAPPALTPAPGNPVVQISTSFGDVTVELFNDKAPVSVANFLEYVADGFYTGTIF